MVLRAKNKTNKTPPKMPSPTFAYSSTCPDDGVDLVPWIQADNGLVLSGIPPPPLHVRYGNLGLEIAPLWPATSTRRRGGVLIEHQEMSGCVVQNLRHIVRHFGYNSQVALRGTVRRPAALFPVS